MAHHTKDKGDLGVAKAFADLVAQGYLVLFPATEHAPFDLVAYQDGRFHRVQVKYRAARRGAVSMVFRSYWSDQNGIHVKPIDKTSIDVVCIYCPDTDECYYLRPTDFRQSVTLRITPSRNNQSLHVLQASNFLELPAEASTTLDAPLPQPPVPNAGMSDPRIAAPRPTTGLSTEAST